MATKHLRQGHKASCHCSKSFVKMAANLDLEATAEGTTWNDFFIFAENLLDANTVPEL